MGRERDLARKRANSKRLRSNPEYRKREAEKTREYKESSEIKKKKVRIQINYERRKKFGITEEQYEAMKEAQSNLCAICGTDTPRGRGDWHVDHDHETGQVRGLLCFPCNTALGLLKDNTEVLENALKYLKLFKN